MRDRVPTSGLRRQGHPLTPHPSPPPSDTGVCVQPGACVELRGPSPTLRTLHLGTGQEPRSSLCCLSCSVSPPISRTERGRVRGDAPSRLLSHQLLLFFFNPFCSQACSLPAKQLLSSSGHPPAPAPCLEPQGAGKEAARPPAAPAELPQERDHSDPPPPSPAAATGCRSRRLGAPRPPRGSLRVSAAPGAARLLPVPPAESRRGGGGLSRAEPCRAVRFR